jgi:hypothetical protein
VDFTIAVAWGLDVSFAVAFDVVILVTVPDALVSILRSALLRTLVNFSLPFKSYFYKIYVLHEKQQVHSLLQLHIALKAPVSYIFLKVQCHEIFDFWFFS